MNFLNYIINKEGENFDIENIFKENYFEENPLTINLNNLTFNEFKEILILNKNNNINDKIVLLENVFLKENQSLENTMYTQSFSVGPVSVDFIHDSLKDEENEKENEVDFFIEEEEESNKIEEKNEINEIKKNINDDIIKAEEEKNISYIDKMYELFNFFSKSEKELINIQLEEEKIIINIKDILKFFNEKEAMINEYPTILIKDYFIFLSDSEIILNDKTYFQKIILNKEKPFNIKKQNNEKLNYFFEILNNYIKDSKKYEEIKKEQESNNWEFDEIIGNIALKDGILYAKSHYDVIKNNIKLENDNLLIVVPHTYKKFHRNEWHDIEVKKSFLLKNDLGWVNYDPKRYKLKDLKYIKIEKLKLKN